VEVDVITFSVLYPATSGASFDHDYYRDKHIPLIQARLGDAVKGVRIEKGRSNSRGGEPPYVAAVHIQFESEEAFGAAMTPHSGEIGGDVANYTTIQPILQISEVVVDS
jgi:uncharacterized protein (TIGR02118 family)